MEIKVSQDPIDLFKEWLEKASKTEHSWPEAMSLATVSEDGQPSVRMVLLKDADQKGFYFYTNMKSRKGQELEQNPKAALCFYWRTQNRQVRVEGRVEKTPAPLVDAYFKSRHYLSRLASWASAQSEELESREALEERVKEAEARYGTEDIPRPPHWAGYIVVPEKIEFWQQGEGRMHDRFLFTREGKGWSLCRLNP